MSGQSVWAVSSGSYSDYSVEAIFEREEDAEAFVKARNGDRDHYMGYFTEEMTFFAAGSGPTHETYYFVEGDSLDNIKVHERRRWSTDTWPEIPDRPKISQPIHGQNAKQWWQATCRDRDAAIKAVKDRIASSTVNREQTGEFVDSLNDRRRGMGLPPI